MKIAIIGNYATQFLRKSLKNHLNDLKVESYEAEYNTVDLEIIDPTSYIYQFQPDFIIWHDSTLGLRDLFYNSLNSEKSLFADNYLSRIDNLIEIIALRMPKTKVIFPNHHLVFNDNIYGNLGLKVESSWTYQIHKLNSLMIQLGLKQSNLYLIESVPESKISPITDYSMVINADLHFTLDYIDWLGNQISNLLSVFYGKFKKCLILDLDNTLWGGIIGDDGIDNIHIGNIGIGKAFTRLQKWIKQLKERGIILAICSKNEEKIAKQPFLEHKEMILKLDDIAIFVANWDSKSDNINQIQKILNIGFDSMVFIDDNPAEREIVRKFIPDIIVPELPKDPADYLPFLISLNLFETVSVSDNDNERTRQYQEEARRAALANTITNMDEYLESLEMIAEIGPITKGDVERVAQLTQRSNQFNLKTKRYTNSDIELMVNNDQYLTATVRLQDKFGVYGLVSVVIINLTVENPLIDTWIMSCRVLKRNVEHLLMNYIVEQLIVLNRLSLFGEYLPTEKNKLVKDLLSDLGMVRLSDKEFHLELIEYKPHEHKIKIYES